MFASRYRLLPAALIACLMLSACGDGGNADQQQSQAPTGTPQQPATASAPARTQPEDPEVATLYQQSCFSCHGTGAGGAPRTGSPAWEPRVAKGMDVLLDHTINGFQGMPPLGMCMDCSEQEFKALIRFMAGMESAE